MAALVAVGGGVLVAALWTDIDAWTQDRRERATLAAADAHLASLRHDVAETVFAKAVTTATRDSLQASIASTMGQLATTNASLAKANVHAYVQGVGIDTLQTCLGGIQSAYTRISAKNNDQAAKDISAVSGACSQLAGGTSTGLVYPFDFPDPDVIRVGSTYYAYATNSVAGNIQIIESSDLSQWTAVGNALPTLPAWAAANDTWAPSVALIGGTFVLYYAVDLRGSGQECISVAIASQPQGPFTDSSTAPLECQLSLGGSIDPSSFLDTEGTPYLVWKSGGPGSSRLWSQQLAPSGTSFVPGTSPTSLLVPDQAWEGGTVEAPDLVTTGGRYDLFYSGNDWNSASYGVGVATCTGPLGPCHDATPNPILSSGPGLAGPGGESVFADATGNFHIAFHAWVPGAVGFPNSRDLYLRPLSFAGAEPAVAASARERLGRGLPSRPRLDRRDQRVAASASARRAMPGASRAAHTSAKSPVGPRQRSSSTRVSSERSIRKVARSLKSSASSRQSSSVVASFGALRTATSQSPGAAGMSSRWPQRASTVAADLAPQPASPGKPSALSPTSAR